MIGASGITRSSYRGRSLPRSSNTAAGDWVLYKSNAPYEPCDVFGVKEFEEIKKKTAANHVYEK
jgi:hypothetical protein